MTFKLIKDITASIIKTIENAAVSSVKVLRSTTYSANIKNFPKTQGVKGTVTVGNQKVLERQMKVVEKCVKDVKKSIDSIKIPEKVSVDNLKDIPKLPEFPKFPSTIEVSNFPEGVSEVTIKNPSTNELLSIFKAVGSLEKEIKKLKLDPKINVQAPKPERLVVPPASVSVTQQDIDYKKLSKELSKIVPTIPELDYQKLADTLSKEMASLVITSGSGGGRNFSHADGSTDKALLDEQRRLVFSPAQEDLTRKYQVADKDDTADPKYYGFTDYTGGWYILREDSNTYRYVKGDDSYPTNWTNRASLTYDYYHEVWG